MPGIFLEFRSWGNICTIIYKKPNARGAARMGEGGGVLRLPFDRT